MADAEQFKKVRAIIDADAARRYIVVSAPGKRDAGDTKITDMLEDCWSLARWSNNYDGVLTKVQQRFEQIAADLALTMDFAREFEIIRTCLTALPQRDYILSRGEYLSAKLMAKYLEAEFIDPADCVLFTSEGELDEERTQEALRDEIGRAHV